MQHDAIQRHRFSGAYFSMLSVKVLRLRYWRQRPRLMQRSVLEMGGLTILLCSNDIMIWKKYITLFDRLWPAHQVRRTAKVRALPCVRI